MTSTPQHPSPLARTTSPFKDPRPAPCTPGNTAQLWDEYERRAVENARRRETAWSTSRRQTQQSRFSSGTVLDIIKSYDPHSSPKISIRRASPHLDFGLPVHQDSRSSIADSTVATCKTCQKPITSTLGICQTCTKTIILSAPTTAVPALPPTASITLSHDELTPFPKHQPPSPPPAQKPTHSPSPLPIRLSSLPTPPPHPPSRPRKSSLPHLQISRKPITPQSPTTPPSISHSTRPTSLANITTPPYRHNSATSSELFQMWPYAETTSPSSVRASYQQRAVSAWEDSDSEDEEKGLVSHRTRTCTYLFHKPSEYIGDLPSSTNPLVHPFPVHNPHLFHPPTRSHQVNRKKPERPSPKQSSIVLPPIHSNWSAAKPWLPTTPSAAADAVRHWILAVP
ncbi:hypothetical protein GRF29_1g3379004 [Pseudopithomyces chartarum]|uniref:Uncharacterized protein n=1 Tax=Pseudopithomyces chartarum TaxID=1892770 RepID=A0AAN6MAA2_9PLEO|nr:hypothetical protein GRF29_1g3379004 [Pseudopithomyces chartarum]